MQRVLASFAFLCLLMVPPVSYSQGTIIFNNRITAVLLDAPVYLGHVGGPGPGPGYSAGLYVVNGSSPALLPGSVVPFRDAGAHPLLPHYINGIIVGVPGTSPGQSLTVRMRAWLTSAGSYEAALPSQRGESVDLVIAHLGGSINPAVNNFLPSEFTGFVIGEGFDFTSNGGGNGSLPGGGGVTTPEPSVWVLGTLGLILLGIRSNRRK